MIVRNRIAGIAAAALVATLLLPLQAGAVSLRRVDAVSFSSSTTGIISGGQSVSGQSGFVSRSTDGGLTWHAVRVVPSTYLRACDASADGTSFLAAAELIDRVQTSTDAISWTPLEPALGDGASVRGVGNIAGGARLAVGFRQATTFGRVGTIARWTGTGADWAQVFEGPLYGLDADENQILTTAVLEAVDSTGSVAYVVGNEWTPASGADGSTATYYRPLIYRSGDAGATWTTQTAGVVTGLNTVTCVAAGSANIAFAGVSNTRYVLRTLDGTNWSNLATVRDGSPTNLGVTDWNGNGIDALDADHVLMAGDNGKISWTANGTAPTPTWGHYTVPTKGRLTGAAMLDATHWIVTGDEETILRTADGGATWTGTTSAEAPGVTITAPAAGFSTGGPTVTVQGTARDAGVGVVDVGVTIQRADGQYWNGVSWQVGKFLLSAETTDNWDTWSYEWTPSLLGGQSVTVIAEAADGVAMTKSSTAVVSGGSPPPTDLLPPVTIASGLPVSQWTSQTVQIRLDSTDGTGTGVDYVRARVGAKVTTGTSPLYVPLSQNGSWTVQFSARDRSGNWEATHSAGPVRIDKTPPLVLSAIATRHVTGGQITGLNVSDPGGSGPAAAPLRWRFSASHPWRSGTPTAPATAGAATLEYFGTDAAGNASEISTAGITVVAESLTRLDGADRWAVSEKVARKGWDPAGNKSWPGVEHVIIACGEDGKEADPLSAAGLAGVYGAPVLVLKVASVPPQTTRVITEIAAQRKKEGKTLAVHIVGGTASVPDARWNTIRAIPGVSATKDRLAGADRYEVSANIAKKMVTVASSKSLTIGGVLIIAADNPAAFYDALAASPAAYRNHMPMLGVRKTSVPGSVSSVLGAQLLGKPRYVVNSTTYVSDGVKSQVGALGAAGRLSTSGDRYASAVDIAGDLVTNGWVAPTEAGLAAKLSDSLTGGTFMGRRGGVLLFTDSTSVLKSAPNSYVIGRKALIDTGWIFGGTASVSSGAQAQFLAALKN